MQDYTITLELPDDVYALLQQRAVAANRTVEEEIVALLEIAFPEDTEPLSEALEETLASLELLGNEALWAAARNRLPQEISTRLEQLNHKQQREGLTDFEMQTLDQLAQQYELIMLTRAQAAVLLKERGYDISDLI